MKLYNQDDLNLLLKKTKKSFNLFVVFVILATISFTCFIIFSFYEKKLLFQLLGSFVTLVFTVFSIYFIDRSLFFKRIATEYLNIFKEKGESRKALISVIKEKPITLSDKSNVYEITCLIDKKPRVLYLSSLFENDLKKDKTYKILIAFNYIKEYYEEA